MVDGIEEFLFVTPYDPLFYKVSEPAHLAPGKGRGILDIFLILIPVQGIVFHPPVVVQIGAGRQKYLLILYFLIVVTDQHGVGPGLIGGMDHLPHRASGIGLHQAVPAFYGRDLVPLLQFDDDHICPLRPVIAGDQEVYPLGCLGNVVLYGNARIGGDLAVT